MRMIMKGKSLALITYYLFYVIEYSETSSKGFKITSRPFFPYLAS